jgi:hypothetical protein
VSASETRLDITADRDGRRHRVRLRLDGKLLFVDSLYASSARERKRFIDAAEAKFASLDRDDLEAYLMDLAGSSDDLNFNGLILPEVDVRYVIRPELFLTHDVSGITVPVVLDGAGELIPSWRTHLRWADGRREVMDLPDRLLMPDGSTLYVHPDPGGPSGSESPAWSSRSRKSWLEGADAPEPAYVFRVVCERLAYYLDFPADAAPGTTATLALWTILTYAYPAWDAVPYLFVGGPMGSGKSRVLDVLQRMVFRPLSSSNLTAPALFRTLHAQGGTMLLDEAERLKQSTPEQVEIQSVFLAGYRRGGCATRLELVGDVYRPIRFNVFGPKALACIAGLPPTLASRCIPVMMFRSAADSEKPKRRIDADPASWRAIRDDLHVLALEYGPVWADLSARKNAVPSAIGGRNYELWQPLLALAAWLQECGCDTLLSLVQSHALVSVANAKDEAIPEADEILLELLAEAVREHRAPTSGDLLADAKRRDEVTFKSWHPRTVASRLKTYGIAVPKKLNGARRYRDVTPAQLADIGRRYGIELGFE